MQRIRISYNKGVELQYTGNLDMHKVWERTLRRAKLPLAYSQGFHPQPKLQQAAPLPLGFTSKAEMLDVWLDTDESIEVISKKIVTTAQPGITVREVKYIPLLSEALPNQVIAAEYSIVCDEDIDTDQFNTTLQTFLDRPSIERERRGKKYDLRPLVKDLCVKNIHPLTIQMTLASLPSATGRPEEVLQELGIDPFTVDIERTRLILVES